MPRIFPTGCGGSVNSYTSLQDLGEEWVAEDMEGGEGSAGDNALDCNIVIMDPEDWGTPWDQVAWRFWVGMVRN